MEIIKNELIQINSRFVDILKSDFQELNDFFKYSFNHKGKLLRIILAILSYKSIYPQKTFNKSQLDFLASVELIHNATLMHDDVIDNAKIRRNAPTISSKFGNKFAVLAGDYFLSVALNLVLDMDNKDLKICYSDSIRAILEGEIAQDLLLFKIPKFNTYIERIYSKTAKLFELACYGVGLIGENINENEILILRQIGKNFGIAYQIIDDLKNFYSYEDKPVQNDYENGIMTLPIIFLTENDKQLKKDIEAKKYDFECIFNMLEDKNCFEKTKNVAQKYLDNILFLIDEFPNTEYKTELKKLINL